MAKILATGVSGVGKTYNAEYLAAHGISAVDADTIDGLFGWYDMGGKQVHFPDMATVSKDFIDSHHFLWNENRLRDYLNDHEEIILFGYAGNVFHLLHLFDSAYLLDLPAAELPHRLDSPSRLNPMGKSVEQKAEIMNYSHHFAEKARQHGLNFIDAQQHPAEIYRQMTGRELGSIVLMHMPSQPLSPEQESTTEEHTA